MSQQSDFVSRLTTMTANLMRITEEIETLNRIVAARGYATWTDADLTGVTVNGQPLAMAELTTLFQRLADLSKFMDNQAVATLDRRTIFNKYRNDL